MSASFTEKQLRATLITGSPNTSFGNSGNNQLVLTGLRMKAVMQGVANYTNTIELKIYGMLPADMNALTILYFRQIVSNQLLVLESNDGSGWHQVFSGTMIEAQPDYRGAPDVFFRVQANFGYFAQVSPAPALSLDGPTDVATVLQTLAIQMGYKLIDNGVTAQISNSNYPGTLWDQFTALAKAASVDFYINGNTISICPKNQGRQNAPQIIIGPQSGLIGYPVFDRWGIEITCLFNPAIENGNPITVQSALPGANGQWTPYSFTHTLESVTPGGAWQSTILCQPVVI